VIVVIVRILIASVGGQGGLTLARIIAEAAVVSGLSARTGETLGMAQRYGSVVSYVQVGTEVYTPKFLPGEADYLVGLELVEALRNIHYLKESGAALVADEYRPPFTMSSERPLSTRAEILEALKTSTPRLLVVPARRLAVEAGSARALNMVMLGALNATSKLFKHSVVEEAIKRVLPPRAVEVSIKAYYSGFKYAESLLEPSK
jgi:indolepyruvate ferredoxin oxidoreductase beta subunit